jgi:acyl-CoA synthetase (NDP forming)
MSISSSSRAASLDALFHPRSIAVIGASDEPGRIGGRPILYSQRFGYGGPVYPINPSRDTVQGLRAWARVGDVPGDIDCAIVALPAAQVVGTLQECAAKGVKGVVLFTGGFAELGDAGERAQAEIGRMVRDSGMRLLGPNCMGAFSRRHHTYLSFMSGLTDGEASPRRARMGIVSQSGGYGSHILHLAMRRGLPVVQMVTTGNEADVEFGEVVEWLAHQPDVDMIVGYIEGIRSRESFLRGLETAHRQGKPVVLLKVGSTQAGAAAAASHTAALAGADAVYDAVLRDWGAYRAGSTEEVMDIAMALSAAGLPLRRRKLAVMSISGGAGVQIADFASTAGLELAPPPQATQRALRELIPFGSPANPVDVTAQVGNQPGIFGEAMKLLMAAGYDSILTWLGPALTNIKAGAAMRDAVIQGAKDNPRVLSSVSVIADPDVVRAFEEAGCLVFEEPKRSVAALAALDFLEKSLARELPPRASCDGLPLLPSERAYNEVDAKRLLATLAIRAPEERLVRTPEEAAAVARSFEAPVAVKVVSPDILHKSEVGGVALGLDTPESAAQAVRRMQVTLGARAPQARIDGYLVSPMLTGVVECIVGVHADPVFGPVVMFGIGGVAVEVLQDVAFALAPLDEAAAEALVRRVKGVRLLEGFRGRPVGDISALAKAISAISKLAARNADRLLSLEVNPLVVLPQGRGVIALDAVVQTGAAAAR